MQDAKTKNELCAEIEALQKNYSIIENYLSGAEYDALEIVGTLQVFRNSLNMVSAHILTLYTLKGQKTKITWDPLLANIDNALDSMRSSAHPKPRAAIQLALNMSEPNIQEVMSYLSKLKESLH